ncbi:MAG: helix-turn-helix domain-containing protein [Solirubrobacterales bacterium]
MAIAQSQPEVGSLLREWRERRRLTQLDLGLEAGVSARHLSFIETGRSKPGREMLLRIAEQLEIPFRDRNHLLLAAGHAPAYPERGLEDPALTPVRAALERILAAHDPYPAVVFDRAWDLVSANASMSALTQGVEIEAALLEAPINILRLGLHPRGLAPLIVNLARWRAHFLERLARQVALTGDSSLESLMIEVAAYPVAPDREAEQADSEILGPVRLRAPGGGEWSFFGMFAGFDTPFEVTTSELAIELLFPADQATAQAFRKGSS